LRVTTQNQNEHNSKEHSNVVWSRLSQSVFLIWKSCSSHTHKTI
jgi:hypothetical protein